MKISKKYFLELYIVTHLAPEQLDGGVSRKPVKQLFLQKMVRLSTSLILIVMNQMIMQLKTKLSTLKCVQVVAKK